MLKNIFSSFVLFLFLPGCNPDPQQADLVLYHAKIYAVDSAFSTYEALAVKDGHILALGTDQTIRRSYTAREELDAGGQFIFPGLIDAHCHFMAYGTGLGQADLTGTKSYEDALKRLTAFAKQEGNEGWLIGRGWDQNDWPDKQYPDRRQLDSLFPHRPVLLYRVDGHAALANAMALQLADINAQSAVNGGQILKAFGKPSGLLIDRAADLVKSKLPAATIAEQERALLHAQEKCLARGLTTVDDAGLMYLQVALIDSLQRVGKLKMRVYAMLSDSAPNYVHYLDKGPYKTDRLNVRAFKFYADGALGSRGACLLQPYADKPGWSGFLLSPPSHFEKCAALMAEKGFQMNTHCIGDSVMRLILHIYEKYCSPQKPLRWRIEHAQVVDPADLRGFNMGILPSVQPTHATSDMPWAIERLGPLRLKNAYAYKALLDATGLLALGTDFPVEGISPFGTFFAAVARQDSSGQPAKGFQPENALTREQALRGMTCWAAYANFEEAEKGSLEKGKLADFVILDRDIMHCPMKAVLHTKVLATYIQGEKVYQADR